MHRLVLKLLGGQVHSCMQTFKKTIFITTLLLLVVAIISAIIIEPMIISECNYYSDASYRKETAGNYDFLFIGDSDGMTAFSPDIFDSKTGCTSYNLSETMLTSGSTYYLLKKEIKRNKIKNVAIQISCTTFGRTPENEHGDGDSVTVQRLDSFADRVVFLHNHSSINESMDIYSRLLVSGLSSWKSLAFLNSNNSEKSAKGWYPKEENNLYLNRDKAIQTYNSTELSINTNIDFVQEYNEIIKLCNDNNINAFFVILPYSDEYTWAQKNLDYIKNYLDEFSLKLNTPVYDFNLYKEKNSFFSDKYSYCDSFHMSEKGGIAFTTCFADFYNNRIVADNKLNSFYDSYVEAKIHSPYSQYIK